MGEFDEAFAVYNRATFQTWVTGGSDRLKPENKTFLYSRRRFKCVHHDDYIPKGTGARTFTRTRQTKCKAEMYVITRVKNKVPYVVEVKTKNIAHNHTLTVAQVAQLSRKSGHQPVAPDVRVIPAVDIEIPPNPFEPEERDMSVDPKVFRLTRGEVNLMRGMGWFECVDQKAATYLLRGLAGRKNFAYHG